MKFSKILWNIIVVLIFIGLFLYLANIHRVEVASIQHEKELVEQSLNEQIVELQSSTLELNKKLEDLFANLQITIKQNEILREQVKAQQFEIESYQAEIANEEAKWQRRYNEYP